MGDIVAAFGVSDQMSCLSALSQLMTPNAGHIWKLRSPNVRKHN